MKTSVMTMMMTMDDDDGDGTMMTNCIELCSGLTTNTNITTT